MLVEGRKGDDVVIILLQAFADLGMDEAALDFAPIRGLIDDVALEPS